MKHTYQLKRSLSPPPENRRIDLYVLQFPEGRLYVAQFPSRRAARHWYREHCELFYNPVGVLDGSCMGFPCGFPVYRRVGRRA